MGTEELSDIIGDSKVFRFTNKGACIIKKEYVVGFSSYDSGEVNPYICLYMPAFKAESMSCKKIRYYKIEEWRKDVETLKKHFED